MHFNRIVLEGGESESSVALFLNLALEDEDTGSFELRTVKGVEVEIIKPHGQVDFVRLRYDKTSYTVTGGGEAFRAKLVKRFGTNTINFVWCSMSKRDGSEAEWRCVDFSAGEKPHKTLALGELMATAIADFVSLLDHREASAE
jgi:hypothetical protein